MNPFERSLAGRLNFAFCFYVNVHLIADAKEKRTRVLHPPLNIRHHEARGDIQCVAGWNSLNQHRHFVVLTVDTEHPVDVRFG